jgi:hypothetical protein
MADADDFRLIRDMVVHGGYKQTLGNVDRTRYQRLVDLGWLDAFPFPGGVRYQVTERGRAAAAR